MVSVKKSFFKRQKLLVLIDYKSIVINYNMLFEAWRVKSCIGLIDYSCLIIDYSVLWDNDKFIQESLL